MRIVGPAEADQALSCAWPQRGAVDRPPPAAAGLRHVGLPGAGEGGQHAAAGRAAAGPAVGVPPHRLQPRVHPATYALGSHSTLGDMRQRPLTVARVWCGGRGGGGGHCECAGQWRHHPGAALRHGQPAPRHRHSLVPHPTNTFASRPAWEVHALTPLPCACCRGPAGCGRRIRRRCVVTCRGPCRRSASTTWTRSCCPTRPRGPAVASSAGKHRVPTASRPRRFAHGSTLRRGEGKGRKKQLAACNARFCVSFSPC